MNKHTCTVIQCIKPYTNTVLDSIQYWSMGNTVSWGGVLMLKTSGIVI